jgi:galactokinase
VPSSLCGYVTRNQMEETIIKAFFDTFGAQPSFLILAPGRINLIGEHTDYNGFPVLPISIPYSITAAGKPRHDAAVHIANLNNLYTFHSFEIAYDIPRSQEGHWANYVKAAAHSLTHV